MSLKAVDAICGPASVPESPATGDSTQDNLHILLVDDDTLARHIVRKALEKCHYKVTAVTSAQEAVRVLESTDVETFQLILTDVVMPVGGDGLDLLEKVQCNAVWRSIPVVMMSANECIETVRECLQRGASHYILKPVTQKEIKSLWQYAYRSATRSLPPIDEPRAPASPSPTGSVPAHPGHPSPAGTAEPPASADAPSHSPAASTLAPAGTNMPLNSAVETISLPWRIRLTVFCQLLHNTRTAFDSAPSSSTAPPIARSQPFSSPASVLISSSTGATAACHTPPHHFSSHYYRAPLARGAAALPTGTPHRNDAASAVFALGVLLLELALAPSPPKARAEYLAALPRVPASLLSAKPDIAVLILRMTAANAAERPSLAQVARERAIYSVYSATAASANVVADQQAAGCMAVRRSFLHKVQESRQASIAEVTADLECIQNDLSRVHAALWHVQSEASKGRTTSDSGADGRTAVIGAVSSDDPAPAVHAPTVPAHISWPRRRTLDTANSMALSVVNREDGGMNGDVRHAGGEVTGHAANSSGWSGRSAPARNGSFDELPSKRQRTENGHTRNGHSGRSDGEASLEQSKSSAGAVQSGPGAPGTPRSECERCGDELKRKGGSEGAGDSIGAGGGGSKAGPGAELAAPPVLDAVRSRWKHVEPLSMQLFGGYREASRRGRMAHEGAPEAVGGAAAGAAAGSADPRLVSAPWLRAVASDLQAVARFRWLPVVASVQHAPSSTLDGNSGRRMVCAVVLDRCEENLAVIGVHKTIRLFRFANLTDEKLRPSEPRYPVNDLAVRSKLTSGCFNAYLQHRLTVADSEGGVTLVDTAANTELTQFEEHVNRVWSIDCSPHDPALMLSASMDKTVRLWSTAQESSVGMIVESHQVCSAVFHPQNSNMLAIGTANATLKLYDVRRLEAPLGTAAAPRAVSYVRFMGDHVVAAAVDSVICMYNTAAVARGGDGVGPVREFRGHLNQRHFVGLACNAEGYIFTGSENNTVCMYHRSVPTALAEQPVVAQDAMGIGLMHGAERPIVNCLTVDKGLNYVVSGGTTGWVNVMKLTP